MRSCRKKRGVNAAGVGDHQGLQPMQMLLKQEQFLRSIQGDFLVRGGRDALLGIEFRRGCGRAGRHRADYNPRA
jgi:hypothetical protein